VDVKASQDTHVPLDAKEDSAPTRDEDRDEDDGLGRGLPFGALVVKDSDVIKRVGQVQSILSGHPHCEALAISLLASSLGAAPPIFVDIPVKVKPGVQPGNTQIPLKLSQTQKDECFGLLMKGLELRSLSYTNIKSTRASQHIFW
jgi:hypothetical protein